MKRASGRGWPKWVVQILHIQSHFLCSRTAQWLICSACACPCTATSTRTKFHIHRNRITRNIRITRIRRRRHRRRRPPTFDPQRATVDQFRKGQITFQRPSCVVEWRPTQVRDPPFARAPRIRVITAASDAANLGQYHPQYRLYLVIHRILHQFILSAVYVHSEILYICRS